MRKLKKCQRRGCKHLVKKPSWLSNKRYDERKYCSRECYFNHMRENKEGWWGLRRFDFRNMKLTPDDVDAIEALKEFEYFKEDEVIY